MKIGIAIDAVHRYGGTTRSTWELAERLAKHHEVTMITRASEATGSEPFRCQIVSVFPDIPYLRSVIFAWKVSRLKQKLGLDILNVHGTNGLWQDVVTAQSVHKKWFFWSLAHTPLFSKSWWLKVLNPAHYVVMFIETLQYSFGLHRKVIAISEQVRSDLLRYFRLNPSRVVVVHHGVNIKEFTPIKDPEERVATRRRLNLSEDQFVIVFVAHEFRRKGLRVILEAMHHLADPNMKLMVVGQDDPKPFQDMIQTLHLEHQVLFLGRQQVLNPYYAASDVFVLPTSYEAFGMVITEAMAAGLPVIVPQDAGAAELITHGKNGLLMDRWDHTKQLAEFLLQLRDNEFRVTVGRNARACVEQHTWDHAAEETLTVFQSIVDESRKGR